MKSDPFSILPALKYIKIGKFFIGPECAEFLTGFYTRGGFKLDLEGVGIAGAVLTPEYLEMLSSFGIELSKFEEAVTELGLYEKVFWYNLVSLEELRAIAATVFLENFKREIDAMTGRVKNAMELALGAAQQGNEVLQNKVKDASEASQRMANLFVSKVVDKNGASGSGGGGR
jgi:hypothetical protein